MSDRGATPSDRTDKGFTWADLLAVLVVGVLLTALLTAALRRTREEANVMRCRDNLRAIGAGLRLYAQDYNGALPVSLTVENPHPECVRATMPKYLSDPKLFYCPSERRPSLSYSEENLQAGIIGYYYYSALRPSTDQKLSKFLRTGLSWPRALNTRLDGRSWVMSDLWVSGEVTAHAPYRKGVNFLTLDGAVDFVGESPRRAFH